MTRRPRTPRYWPRMKAQVGPLPIRLGQVWKHKRDGHTVTITSQQTALGFIKQKLPGEEFLRERLFRKKYELLKEDHAGH